MKTQAFLRISLLIPFIVWVLCLGIFLIVVAASVDTVPPGDSVDLSAVVAILAMFYVFGIFVWIFPYLLLAAILFFWSFIAQARTALRVYALSPLAMTFLTVATLNIMMLWNFGDASNPSTFEIIDQGWVSMNLLAVGFALVCGYICVGIGSGIYKLLHGRGFIRDEQIAEPLPQPL